MIRQKYFLLIILNQIFLSIHSIKINNANNFSEWIRFIDYNHTQNSILNISTKSENKINNNKELICSTEPDLNDYEIYPLSPDDKSGIGDVMPYFDFDSNELLIFYLKDVWNDEKHERHPWYGIKTNNFYSYSLINQEELLSSNKDSCKQDYAIGTGSIIKKDKIYYGFYTGHNPNSPSDCVKKKEGIMLATSTNLNEKFVKDLNFKTIYAPINQGFDEEINFRDPFVIYESSLNKYILIVSTRTLRGVIISYISSDLYNWIYQGIIYDGDSDYFYMMETVDLFKINKTFYLLFSDIDSKYVFYRKSLSLNGPWEKPKQLEDHFDGNAFYGAKVIVDNHGDHYILAWTNRLQNNNDQGEWIWGGNLIIHKLYQIDQTKDLAVTIPHTIKHYLDKINQPILKYTQWGFVQTLANNSYLLSSLLNSDVTNIIFNPINLKRYKISVTVSFTRSIKDFGFMIGMCEDFNQFYSLRFIPSQQKFSFDKMNHSSLTTTTISNNYVKYKFIPNTDYIIDIIIENSMVVTYLDNKVALTNRIYKVRNHFWGIFADNSNVYFKNISLTRP